MIYRNADQTAYSIDPQSTEKCLETSPGTPIQPYGAIPQAANPAAGDGVFISTVETGATSQAKASDVRRGSKLSNRNDEKGHNPLFGLFSCGSVSPTEKKHADKNKEKGAEPWTDYPASSSAF